MRRAPALALLALSACTSGEAATCPGQPVGTFRFEVVGTYHPPDDPAPALFCEKAATADSSVVGTFTATLSSEPALGTAALCVAGAGRLAQPYFGRVEAGTYVLTAAGGLGVLDACGANCTAQATLRVEGTVAAGGFVGTLTETFQDPQGACGACAFPCEKTYPLTGAP
ncbi:MAG: hypothetical protein QM704_28075 [Anaeromyxobacteraceae bacterium]